MKNLYGNLILLLIMMFPAQHRANAEEGWTHYHHKTINNIAVDDDNVWCCHKYGILRWSKDGSSHTNYETQYGYNAGSAYDVDIDENGVVWVAAQEGIMYFENNIWHSFQIDIDQTGRVFTTVFVGPNGKKWFGGKEYITWFDGKTWQAYSFNGNAYDIEADQQGNVWLATIDGVYRFKDDSWREFSIGDGLADGFVFDIEFDDTNTGWFSTLSGVSCFDGENWETFSHRQTQGVEAGEDGTMWFAVSYTDSAGVFSHDGENWTYYEEMAGIDANTIYEDDDGTIWCGTQQGLYKKDGENWLAYLSDDSMPEVAVSDIAVNHNGDVWVATTNVGTIMIEISPSGTLRFDGSGWTQFTVDDGLLDNDVKSIAVDPEGRVWCGFKDGISRYDGSAWTSWDYPYESVYLVGTITFDKEGNGWFGHEKGLLRYDRENEKITEHISFNDVYQTIVKAIAIDDNNTVWLCSNDGIYKQVGAEWIFYPDPYKNYMHVKSLAVDHDGSLWMGTYSQGIRRFDGVNWEVFDVSHGLLDNRVYDITIDNNGVKWIATNRGISLFDGKSWEKFDTSNSPLPNARYFAKDSENRMWIAGMWDLYSFDEFITPVSVATQPISILPLVSSFPNPFNMSTSIEFSLPSEDIVTISVFSSSGQKIRSLLSESFPQGRHIVRWDGLDDHGLLVSSGVYIVGLKAGKLISSRRMTLVK